MIVIVSVCSDVSVCVCVPCVMCHGYDDDDESWFAFLSLETPK